MLYKKPIALLTSLASVYRFLSSITLYLIETSISASSWLYLSTEARCLMLLLLCLAFSLSTVVFNTINRCLLKSLTLMLVK